MARPIIGTFPPASTTVLYPTSVGGGGETTSIALAIPYPVVFPNLQRNITFTSTDDLATTNFTITGTDIYGNIISEVLAGPNNDTVTSVKQYHQINAIASSGNYTNFSIGYGSTALFSWFSLDTLNTYASTTLTATVYGTINYSINQTLDAISTYQQPVGPTYRFIYPQAISLVNNPLATTNTSATVTVTIPSTAELSTGSIVTIQNAAATGGISAANLNITAVITVVNSTSFTYTAGANATSTVAAGGGANVSYYYPSFPTSYPIAEALTDATTSQLYSITAPLTAIQGIVNSSTAPGTLTLTLLQQGIN